MDTFLSPASLPAGLVAQIGEVVATRSAAALAKWPAAPPDAAAALAQIEGLGLQLQELMRMLQSPVRTQAEPVDLGVAAVQARAEWAAAFQRAGASWTGPEYGCKVITNPAVLKQLLDLAIGHALGLGPQIKIEVSRRADPPLAALRVEASRPGGEMFSAHAGDAAEMHWALLSTLAQHAGVHVERQVRALSVELLLGWPPAGVLQPQSLPELATLPQSQIPSGCRVLLLEPNDLVRVQAERLMLQAGLHVRSVATVDQAQAALMHGLPECLVTGVEISDRACGELVQDLRARQPGLRVLEIVAQPHAFAMSMPGMGSPARIARDSLDSHLVTALAQELTTPL